MKKIYQVPSTKTKAIYDKDIQAIVTTSDGYEQGVSGNEGTDDEARTPLFFY